MTEASKYWNIDAELVPSKTSPEGRIVVVRGLRRRSRNREFIMSDQDVKVMPLRPNRPATPSPSRSAPMTDSQVVVLADRTEPAKAAARARHRQPEGRRRQDHDRDQSRHRARRHRRARADHRSRSAGQRLDRARHRPPQPPRLDLRRADRRGAAARGDRRDRGAAAVDRAVDAWICPASSSRSARRATAPSACARAIAPLNAGKFAGVGDFSYVLVDCPPSLNLLTVNAMAAANAILVPLQCEFFALEGLSQLLQDRRAGARPRSIPSSRIHGIVLTMYDARNNLSEPGRRRRARVHGRARSTTPSSRAMCASPKRRPTASRCWSTISNASAAKPICGSRPKSSSAKKNCARRVERCLSVGYARSIELYREDEDCRIAATKNLECE